MNAKKPNNKATSNAFRHACMLKEISSKVYARLVAIARLSPLSLLLAGFAARLFFAPLAASGDIHCWHNNAKDFLAYGFDIYLYELNSFPPVWVFICTLSYLVAPTINPYHPAFRVAVKFPMIIADLLTGYVLYKWFDGRRGYMAAALWLLNPMSIFVTGIFGMFDPILVAFLAISAYMLKKEKVYMGAIFAGLALMTKQYAIFALPPILAFILKKWNLVKALKSASVIIAVFGILTLPFCLNGSFGRYMKLVWPWLSAWIRETVSSTSGRRWIMKYNHPRDSIGSGLFQTLTLLHYATTEDGKIFELFKLSLPMVLFLLVLSIDLAYSLKDMNPSRAILMGIFSFLLATPRIDPQFIISFIPFFIIDVLQFGKSRKWLITTAIPVLWIFFAWGPAIYFVGYAYPIRWVETLFLPWNKFLEMQVFGRAIMSYFLVAALALALFLLLLGYLISISWKRFIPKKIYLGYNKTAHQGALGS